MGDSSQAGASDLRYAGAVFLLELARGRLEFRTGSRRRSVPATIFGLLRSAADVGSSTGVDPRLAGLGRFDYPHATNQRRNYADVGVAGLDADPKLAGDVAAMAPMRAEYKYSNWHRCERLNSADAEKPLERMSLMEPRFKTVGAASSIEAMSHTRTAVVDVDEIRRLTTCTTRPSNSTPERSPSALIFWFIMVPT